MDAKLAGVLLDLQKNAPELQKNAINPHFKNKYVTLDELLGKVLPLLHERGIVLIQAPCETSVGEPGLRTSLWSEGGCLIDDIMPLTLDKTSPQAQGSAITYARRYALMSILGLVADEDDDGEKATTSRRVRTTKPKVSSAGTPEDAVSGGDYF